MKWPWQRHRGGNTRTRDESPTSTLDGEAGVNETGLGMRTVQGLAWTGTAAAAHGVLHLVRLVILARLLSPSDFGIVAMAMVLVSLSGLVANMGIGEAIIYRHQVTRNQLSSLYWLNVSAGAVVTAVLVAVAPLAASVYGEPQLQDILQWMAIGSIIAALGKQYEVLLRKELRFKHLALIESAAAFAGFFVILAAAALGAGLFAYVWGLLAEIGARTCLLLGQGFKQSPPRLHFRWHEIQGYVGFGIYRTGDTLANRLSTRSGQLILGAMLGVASLGYYQLAFNIAFQPIQQLNPVFNQVMFPVMTKIRNDPEKLRRYFFHQLHVLALLVAPVLLGLAAIAPLMVPTLLGQRWVPAVPIVQVLALVGLLSAFSGPLGSMYLASGLVREVFWSRLLLATGLIPTMLLGVHFGGPAGVAVGWLVLRVVYMALTHVWLTRRIVGPDSREYINSLAAPLAAGSVMALAVFTVATAIGEPGDLVVLLELVGLGVLIYLALVALLLRSELTRVLVFTRRYLGSRMGAMPATEP